MYIHTHRTQPASQAKLARKNPTKISKAKFLYRVGGKKHPPNNFTPYCYSPLPPKIQCWSAKGGDTCGREKNTRSCRGDPRVGLNIEFWGEGGRAGGNVPIQCGGCFFPPTRYPYQGRKTAKQSSNRQKKKEEEEEKKEDEGRRKGKKGGRRTRRDEGGYERGEVRRMNIKARSIKQEEPQNMENTIYTSLLAQGLPDLPQDLLQTCH